jgi:hypothetical protein
MMGVSNEDIPMTTGALTHVTVHMSNTYEQSCQKTISNTQGHSLLDIYPCTINLGSVTR